MKEKDRRPRTGKAILTFGNQTIETEFIWNYPDENKLNKDGIKYEQGNAITS